MKLPTLFFLVIIYIIADVNGDCYLHNPRGSNNRLDENSRERKNADRLFDSQNNNRGGYNVGEESLFYYSGSELPIEWTNQHSCGNPNNHCEIIIQYMCGDKVRDGTSTKTIKDKSSSETKSSFGMNEGYQYYKDCKETERNKGLFTADQKLAKDTAIYTRQNNNGDRRGFECPEERDYYPYWRPSPWKDIVIMTNDIWRCKYYKKESQNLQSRFKCSIPKDQKFKGDIPNNKQACEAIDKATWTEIPSHNIPAPDCIGSKWSRDNHLGNGKGGFTNKYVWKVPDLEEKNCVMRIRYNISTNDYNGWTTTSQTTTTVKRETPNEVDEEEDEDELDETLQLVDIGKNVGLSATDSQKRGYIFKDNPEIQILGSTVASKLKLQLAVNTAQYGRTFQDRSHTFAIKKRPSNLKNVNIFNMNVRGKRGNIVQVYPAVEYDFVPNRLNIAEDDYVHFQWTGSDKNPKGNAGEGTAGTDRSNVALLKAPQYDEGRPGSIFPTKFGQFGNNYPEKLKSVGLLGFSQTDQTNLAQSLKKAYFDLGPKKATSSGTYFYMSTRNNNFSNRNQKGKIVVSGKGKSGDIGWAGGDVKLSDGVQGISVQEDSVAVVQSFTVQEWSIEEGNRYITSKGGEMNEGDDYASKFMVILPMEKLTEDEATFEVKIKTDPEIKRKSTIYHSIDTKNWHEIQDVTVNDASGVASFDASKGGFYVARYRNNEGKKTK